jgi:hypothetical protein
MKDNRHNEMAIRETSSLSGELAIKPDSSLMPTVQISRNGSKVRSIRNSEVFKWPKEEICYKTIYCVQLNC